MDSDGFSEGGAGSCRGQQVRFTLLTLRGGAGLAKAGAGAASSAIPPLKVCPVPLQTRR